MAPNVTVSFWDPYDINGTPIHTIDDEDPNFKGLLLKPDLNGLGGWQLTLSREWAYGLLNDQAARGDVFVRFLISAYSDTDWYWGGLLDKRQIDVVHKDELGAEEFILGGSGPKRYLDRFRLGIERNTPSGWKLDLANGVWRWGENATAGSVLRKLITEDQNTDPVSLVDLTASFTASDDSNSDPWTEEVADADGNFELPIGTSLLDALFDLEDIGDLVTTVYLGTVASPVYRLDAWQTYGEDVTGSAFGTGVGLLREGDNIANDSLTVAGVLMKKATHVIIEGKDGVWAKKVLPAWSPGDYVRWAKIEYTRSSNVPTLQRAGLRWLRRQDNGDKQLEVEIVPGADDTQGLYFPSPSSPIWLGNTVTVDTVADGSVHSPMDYNEEPALVTGLELELGKAGSDATADAKAKSWNVKVKLNHERSTFSNSPNQSSASSNPGNGGGGGCKCIKLCHEAIPAEDASQDQFLNANDPGGTNPDWQGLLGNQGGSGHGANGTDWYNFKSAGSAAKYQHSRACTVGQTITVEGWWGCRSDGHLILTFTTAPAGSASATIQAAVISTEDLHIDGPGHSHNPQEWTFFSQSYTVPATTVSYALGHSGADINFDEITVSLGATIPAEDVLSGTDGNAARCDHQHHQISESAPTVNDDESLGYRVGTVWLVVDDIDNPTVVSARYVLLDATDGAAVWVELPDGSEPTADAHIADTSDAHDASAISILDTGSNFTATDVEAALAEIQDRIDALPPSGIGEILISDTPSTPLVFADLIQNEAQDDLVYADP